MKSASKLSVIAFLAVALAFISIVSTVRAYPAGPPPGVTGGFGEPTCSQSGCHATFELNAGKAMGLGDLVISGFPKQYEPGKAYPIKMTITHATPDRVVFGFQFAARVKDSGTQAGELHVTEDAGSTWQRLR